MKRAIKCFTFFILILFAFYSLGANIEEQTQAVLKSVSSQQLEKELKVTIELEGQFTYQSFEMSNPPRLVIEFSIVTKVLSEPSSEIHAFGVETIRTGQYLPNLARVVFDFSKKSPFYKISQIENKVEATFWLGEERAGVEEIEKAQGQIPKEPAQLKDISYEKSNDKIKVKVELEGPFRFETLGSIQSSKLMLEFWPVEKVSAKPSFDVGLSGLKRVSVEKFNSQRARVVFDLAARPPSFKVQGLNGAVDAVFWYGEEPRPKGQKLEAKEELGIPELERMMIGLSLGSYNVSSDLFEEVYGKGGAILGLDLSRILYTKRNINLGLGLEARHYSKTGASTITKDEAKFSITSFSLAGKFLINIKDFLPYYGAGLDYYKYAEESVLQDTSGSTIGYHMQAGVYCPLPKAPFLKVKLFLKLTRAIAKQEETELNIGGLEYGINLSYSFDF